MPRAKKTTAAEVSVATPDAEAKRKRTTKPAVVSHKHTTKKAAQVEPVTEQATRTVSPDQIAQLAYSYWEARGFQGGSAEEDWFRAERELLVLPQDR